MRREVLYEQHWLDAQRDTLLGLSEQLAQLIQRTEDDTKPVDLDEPIGRISRMDAMQQQKMQTATRQAAQLRHRQVVAALARFAENEYGECLGCGEEIEIRRLEAQPEAPFCLACQSQRERTA